MQVRIWCLGIVALATAAQAQTPDYFPLHVGNTWVYRQSGRLASASATTISVRRADTFDGRTYHLVTGLTVGGSEEGVWLRMREDSTLVALNLETRAESPLVAFGTPEGERFDTVLDPCTRTGRIEARMARVTVPIGDFGHALKVAYLSANCADAGLSEEFYLPHVGLLRRTSLTIAGPVNLDLVYARVGALNVSEQEVAFSLSLDRSVYFVDRMPGVGGPRPAPVLTARLALRATQERPLRLTFSSGQTYDLVIRNERGETVYQWSADKQFIQAIRTVDFTGETVWPVPVRLEANGRPLPAGRYTAEAFLTTGATRTYLATVAFEVQEVF